MPIAPNYTLLENAVYECAWAGCETIWIICNDDVAPLKPPPPRKKDFDLLTAVVVDNKKAAEQPVILLFLLFVFLVLSKSVGGVRLSI